MANSTATILTGDGERIVKRLCNHWKHKFEISMQDNHFEIPFPEAKVKLHPTADAIYIQIKTDNTEQISRYEKVVLDHINRMAQQEFKVTWQHG